MSNIVYYLKYAIALITAVCLVAIMFIDPSNFAILLTFTIITVTSSLIPKKLLEGKPPELTIWIDNVGIASFWFIIGFFVFKVTTSKEILDKIPFAIFFITFTIIVVVFSFSVLFSVISVQQESQKTRTAVTAVSEKVDRYERLLESSSGGIGDFPTLFKKVIAEQPDIILIAGNLLTMSTNDGADLVNEYLLRRDTNKLKLIIPESSKSLLPVVKSKIGPGMLNRLEIYVANPFWFLQGILILGRRKISTDDNRIDPYGCIYYNIKTNQNGEYSKEGIYIDLKNTSYGDLKDSFAAYYSLMNTLEYSEGDYKVNKVFKKWNSRTRKDEIIIAKNQVIWNTI